MSGIHEVMEQALVGVRPKPTMKDLIGALDLLQKTIDDADEITPEMIKDHFDSVAAVDQKTDALISVMERLEMEAAAASTKADAYKQKAKTLENNLERVKGYVKWLLQTYPDLALRGTKGKLGLQKSADKLIYSTPKDRFSSDSVVPDLYLDLIPDKFRTLKTVWVYNRDAIVEGVKAKDQDAAQFAKFEENYYVRKRI